MPCAPLRHECRAPPRRAAMRPFDRTSCAASANVICRSGVMSPSHTALRRIASLRRLLDDQWSAKWVQQHSATHVAERQLSKLSAKVRQYSANPKAGDVTRRDASAPVMSCTSSTDTIGLAGRHHETAPVHAIFPFGGTPRNATARSNAPI